MNYLIKSIIFLRSIFAAVIFVTLVLVLSPIALFLNFVFNNKLTDDLLIQFWAHMTCLISGVRLRVIGRENIPNAGCLFLFNHSSFFDIFAMAAEIRGFRFGAKEELFKIPFFGAAMRRAGTLVISRGNREQVFKVYEEAKTRFAKGEQFALSPEGGRFYGDDLSKFKAGPFIFAMSAGAPLVPVMILGAYEVLPKGAFLFNNSRWSSEIIIKILEPIPTSSFSLDERTKLQELVYERMNQEWLNYYKDKDR